MARAVGNVTVEDFKEIATSISMMERVSDSEDKMIEVDRMCAYFPNEEEAENWNRLSEDLLFRTKVAHLILALRVEELKHDIGATDDETYERQCRIYLDANTKITKMMLDICEDFNIHPCTYITPEVEEELRNKTDGKSFNPLIEALKCILGEDDDDDDDEPEVSFDAEGNEYRIEL